MTTKRVKSQAPVHIDQTVSTALTAILGHDFNSLQEWEAAAHNWENIEGVHQMRVLFRRMRSALSVFRSAVPRSVSGHWARELSWLAGQLGPARDLDVFIQDSLGGVRGKLPLPGWEKLNAIAFEHRAQAYESVREMLNGERYAQFKQEFPRWYETAAWHQAELNRKQRNNLDACINTFSRTLLDILERQVLQAGTDVDRNSAAEMHQLRIECKKLRYAAEFFMPITAGLDTFIGHMRGLQEILGIMNDVAVMQHLLDTLLQDQEDKDLIRYAGALMGWRTRQYFDLLEDFDARWMEFIHAKHPWWHKHPQPITISCA